MLMEFKGLVDPKKKAEVLKALKEGRGKEIFKGKGSEPVGKLPEVKPAEEPAPKTELLLEKQERLNLALIEAAREGSSFKVERLLKTGADVNAKPGGVTALIVASAAGNLDVVKLLVEKGANLQMKFVDRTAFLWSVTNGHTDVASFLIGQGADVNEQDGKGKSAIRIAIAHGHIEIVDALRRAGATE
jgi:hypothetical protein